MFTPQQKKKFGGNVQKQTITNGWHQLTIVISEEDALFVQDVKQHIQIASVL